MKDNKTRTKKAKERYAVRKIAKLAKKKPNFSNRTERKNDEVELQRNTRNSFHSKKHLLF